MGTESTGEHCGGAVMVGLNGRLHFDQERTFTVIVQTHPRNHSLNRSIRNIIIINERQKLGS
jgi:hypothetical protein